MKKLSKRVLALVLSAIIAMPAVFAMPFSASADNSYENIRAQWDYTSGGEIKSDSDGEYHYSLDGKTKMRLVHYGDNSYTFSGGGINTYDGYVYVENLSDILDDGFDVDIDAFLYIGKEGNSENYGLFSIGSQMGDVGESSFNDLVYLLTNGTVKYRRGGASENIRQGEQTAVGEGDHTFKVHFSYEEKALYVYLDGALIGYKQDDGLSYSDFNFLAMGVWQPTYYENAVFKTLKISQPCADKKTYITTKINNADVRGFSAKSKGIKFSSGGNAYTENVLYSENGNFDSNSFTGSIDGDNKLSFTVYPASSRVVYLYDGDNTAIGYPLITKIQKDSATATTFHWGVNYLAVDTANNWSLADDWYICSGDRVWDNIFASQTDKAYGVNKINFDVDARNHYNENIQVGNFGSHPEGHFTEVSPKTLSNKIMFDSSALDFGDSYYCSIPDVPTFKANADGCAHWLGSQGAWNAVDIANAITINGKTGIDLKVLNVEPLKDIVSSSDFIDNYNDISANEALYTSDSLNSYYDVIERILDFNVNRLDVSDDEALAASANEIKSLVDDYNAYKTPVLKTPADVTELRKAYSKSNNLLLGLNKKAAQYDSVSLQALIDAVSNDRVVYYLSIDDVSVLGDEVQAEIDALTDSINSAYDALRTYSEGTDTTSYEAAVNVINNLDKDAYNSTSSISSAKRTANLLVNATEVSYVDALDSENTSSIPVLTSTATQTDVDDATRTILDSLYYSIKRYTIVTNDVVVETSFQNGTSTGESSPYTATYGSTVIARTDIDETAWYMDFSSESTTRARQYQDFGSSFNAKVFGNINIYAETRSDTAPNMVRVLRHYSNDSEKTPIQFITFAGSSYTLPEAPAYASYSFEGYEVNGVVYPAGETVSITGDVDIKAIYNYNGTAQYAVNATALENGTGFNDSVEYNTKVELKGGDNAYAWVETVDAQTGKVRPFAIESDITFYVSESITLNAVTEEEFNSYNFSLPTINMRKEGVIISGRKVTFNGQLVASDKKVKEYGVVVGISKNGEPIDEDKVTVDNAGQHEGYDVIRAKSSISVGANQFSIGINGLAGKDFVYKGYVIYEKTKGEFVTVYTE